MKRQMLMMQASLKCHCKAVGGAVSSYGRPESSLRGDFAFGQERCRRQLEGADVHVSDDRDTKLSPACKGSSMRQDEFFRVHPDVLWARGLQLLTVGHSRTWV